MPTTEKPGLTRDAIKYLAIFTMLLNHIANVLLPENTILWEVFIDIGYFTAITMCYFLVEGFYYTHSRRKYGERLLIFAGISQVPYMMAFGNPQLNMIFTLFICFMILVVQERMMASKWRIPLLILLLLLSVCSDWAILAPVFTIWFHESWGNRKRMITAYGVGAALFVLFNYSSYVEKMAAGPAMIHALLSAAGIVASGIIICASIMAKNPKSTEVFQVVFLYLLSGTSADPEHSPCYSTVRDKIKSLQYL